MWEEWQEIEENNKLYELGDSDFKRSFYNFSSLSDEDFDDQYLGAKPVVLNVASSAQVPLKPNVVKVIPPECQNLPAYKNWAEEEKLTPVIFQDNCGCCYIFSSVGVLESTVAIKNGSPLKKLSIQNTLECAKVFGPKDLAQFGCDGGRPEVCKPKI